jgi:hypothetical protein
MKKIIDFIKGFFSEDSKASSMRLLSFMMFFVATFYLFYSFKHLIGNIDDVNLYVVLLHVLQNVLNFAYAFFPKVLQKKFEEVDMNKITGKKDV